MARDAKGNGVLPLDPKACMWCLRGAILKVVGRVVAGDHTALLIEQYLASVMDQPSLIYWHDDTARTHQDIIDLVDMGIERL